MGHVNGEYHAQEYFVPGRSVIGRKINVSLRIAICTDRISYFNRRRAAFGALHIEVGHRYTRFNRANKFQIKIEIVTEAVSGQRLTLNSGPPHIPMYASIYPTNLETYANGAYLHRQEPHSL